MYRPSKILAERTGHREERKRGTQREGGKKWRVEETGGSKSWPMSCREARAKRDKEKGKGGWEDMLRRALS